ncbi:MAG: hypothetical protein QM702_06155 [Rubrivivax sp.]
MHVAVLVYPGCIFFEIALAAEVLAGRCTLSCCTPDGEPFGSLPTPASSFNAEAIR